MSTTVNLAIKANTLQVTEDLIEKIESSIKQSSCWVIDTFKADHGIQYRIKAFSDKLEKLYDQLCTTGLELFEGSEKMLENAAGQYSVYRDIEITLVVNEIPQNLSNSTLIQLAGGVI